MINLSKNQNATYGLRLSTHKVDNHATMRLWKKIFFCKNQTSNMGRRRKGEVPPNPRTCSIG